MKEFFPQRRPLNYRSNVNRARLIIRKGLRLKLRPHKAISVDLWYIDYSKSNYYARKEKENKEWNKDINTGVEAVNTKQLTVRKNHNFGLLAPNASGISKSIYCVVETHSYMKNGRFYTTFNEELEFYEGSDL